MTNKTLSDGSSTDYYKLPSWARDLIDLIEHKKMNFAIGNIFKACYRLGEKEGIDREYDLRKIKFFIERELAQVEREAGRSKADATLELRRNLIVAGIAPPASNEELEFAREYYERMLARAWGEPQ